MKNLNELINEQLINEAAWKDLRNPRKGSTVYVLKDGESKAIQVKIVDVYKTKKSKEGSYDVNIELGDNKYDFDGYTEYVFGTINYDGPKLVNAGTWVDKGTFYIGVSKEAIQEYINTNAANQLKGVLNQIADAEKELAELYKKKEKYEAKANLQISESLVNEGKKIDLKKLEQSVEVHLDTVYNDGYDSPQEAMKALRELADKGEGDMLDYLTAAIDAHDGEITEDDLLDNWDDYSKIAQKIAKEWSK